MRQSPLLLKPDIFPSFNTHVGNAGPRSVSLGANTFFRDGNSLAQNLLQVNDPFFIIREFFYYFPYLVFIAFHSVYKQNNQTNNILYTSTISIYIYPDLIFI